MLKTTLRSRSGFTLIELLTVIAIIGILAAILFPAIGAARRSAQKASDLSNIRSIGQAAIIYASDNNDRLPDPIANDSASAANKVTGGDHYYVWFGLLAKNGNLADPAVTISKIDPLYPAVMPTAIVNPTNKNALDSTFLNNIPSFEVVGGIKVSDPSTTPVAYTRGLQKDGTWDTLSGTYGTEGGFVVFVGGNVASFKNIGSPSSLTQTTGKVTADITQAVPYTASGNQRLYGPGGANGGSTVGSLAGTRSTPSS
jgi:prepilin-type N-terminal cleavage/methylation domain-containing protein